MPVVCHAIDKKVVGPAYKDVAKKYGGDKFAIERLEHKVKNGGSGAWGTIPMPPNNISDADIEALVNMGAVAKMTAPTNRTNTIAAHAHSQLYVRFEIAEPERDISACPGLRLNGMLPERYESLSRNVMTYLHAAFGTDDRLSGLTARINLMEG